MGKNNKKGFTLVELLAVIVVLAIILVIAVPKIMQTISQSKVSSMESSAKLAAKAVEKAYQISLATGEEGTLSRSGSCMDIADLDESEYSSCTYEINEKERAVITLKGTDTGKFATLECVDGTVNNAICTPYKRVDSMIKEATSVQAYNYDKDYNQIATDDTTTPVSYTDYRYYGATPNNYVKIDNSDDLWRIIGIVNGQVKIIRDKSLTTNDANTVLLASFDSTGSDVNGGHGINYWKGSDLETLLNNYYLGKSNTCNYCNLYNQETCTNACTSYSSLKLSSAAISLIDENATWYIAAGNCSEISNSNLKAKDVYKNEHGTKTGKTCDGSYAKCNDTVVRTTTWNGAIGLMSLSDYAYATNLSVCTKALYKFLMNAGYNDSTCTANNWIYQGHSSEAQWTITPIFDTRTANAVATVGAHIMSDGQVYNQDVFEDATVRPAAFLKTTVYIQSGTGTSTDPYVLILK